MKATRPCSWTRSLIPSSPYDWAVRATEYTNLLNQYLGAAAGNVELLTTEFNSVYSNPGKQTTSLVNGLFIADSLGELLQTSYDGAIVWDLRNGPYDTSNNDSSSLYGWREGGDYGLLGSPPMIRPRPARTSPIRATLPSSLPPTSSRPAAASSRPAATTRTWPSMRFTRRMETSTCW